MVKEIAEIVYQAEIATDIYSLLLKVTFARDAVPGQFVSLYSADRSRLLPRPISICETDAETGTIRLVYRIAGKGTKEFSGLKGGDKIEILGPLGNGFPIDEYREKRVESQPIEFPNGGSTFKRGDGFITAKLIDEAGLKGKRIGGAEISKKHAGFIINKDNATAKDILELSKYVQDEVLKKFNKKIELEVRILGE